ncbi:preprotein translocase subunit SecG [Bacteroidia bacterium]|nr:preprotein translocase subunit SecG [Bacteroidia bacterium]
MYSVITVLMIIVCVFLVLVVLVQNSKGGGLAANFSSSNQILGVRKTADFLEKATWTLASAMVVLCIFSAIYTTSGRDVESDGSIIEKQVENAVDPNAIGFPAAQPEQPTE